MFIERWKCVILVNLHSISHYPLPREFQCVQLVNRNFSTKHGVFSEIPLVVHLYVVIRNKHFLFNSCSLTYQRLSKSFSKVFVLPRLFLFPPLSNAIQIDGSASLPNQTAISTDKTTITKCCKSLKDIAGQKGFCAVQQSLVF